MSDDPVRYRILLHEGVLKVVEVQSFDIPDYDERRWFVPLWFGLIATGAKTDYDTEEEARRFIANLYAQFVGLDEWLTIMERSLS